LVIGFLLTRDIGRRLGAVSEAASRIARGDLDVRITPKGSDEITDVAVWVNRVTDHMSERIDEEKRFAKYQETEKARIATAVQRYGGFVSRISQGDLTARLEKVEGDELERLGDDLSSMAEGLRTITLRVHDAVEALSG